MIEIGQASRLSGVGIETIRYYEREGIIPAAARALNNRRVYGPTDVGRLRFLKRCRDLGFGLADARRLLDLSEHQSTDCQQAKEMAQTHIADVRAKIAALATLDAALSQLTANCDGGSRACPMLDRLRMA